MDQRLTIGKPEARLANGEFMLSAELSAPFSDHCFYSLPEQFKDWVDPSRSDCFMVGLLYTAMFAGLDLHLEGTVSEKLLFTLNTYAVPILNGLDPRLKKIRITAAATTSAGYPSAAGSGTGFSGGIDSFYTLLRRGPGAPDMPERFRINTLFFFNVGAHGMGKGEERQKWLEEKFHSRYAALKGFADEYGLPFIPVNSNLHWFHQSGHLQTHTLASISAALFVSARLAYYYFGSAGHSYHTMIRGTNSRSCSISSVDNLLLPNLATESFLPMPDGADASRAEKTAAVADSREVRKYLNVCGNSHSIDRNCSECFKCRRTMLTLDILGKLPAFSEVFDLSKFSEREKRRYIADVLNRRREDPLSADICELAEARNYRLEARTSRLLRLYMRFTRTRLFSRLHALRRHTD